MSNNGVKDETVRKKSFLSFIKEQVTPIITLVTLIGVIFTGYFWLDNRYARAEAVAQLNQRFELKLKEDTRTQIQEGMWKLQDRLVQQPNDTTAKEQLREYEVQKSNLDKEIDVLRNPSKR